MISDVQHEQKKNMTVKYYKVGGCVRDEILGVKNKDIDFAVEASSYEEMRDDLLENVGVIIYQERPEFFAIRAGHPVLGGVDYTLCRKEGFYWDNRHPDHVVVGTLMDDLSRRDFTVNAIAKDEGGILIDPFKGQADLAQMMLKCVGKAEDRFDEDALRLLRAVRFHIVRGFELHYSIKQSFNIPNIVEGLTKISVERIYEELKKCFEHDTWKTLKFFENYSFLKYVIFEHMRLGLTPRIP